MHVGEFRNGYEWGHIKGRLGEDGIPDQRVSLIRIAFYNRRAVGFISE